MLVRVLINYCTLKKKLFFVCLHRHYPSVAHNIPFGYALIPLTPCSPQIKYQIFSIRTNKMEPKLSFFYRTIPSSKSKHFLLCNGDQMSRYLYFVRKEEVLKKNTWQHKSRRKRRKHRNISFRVKLIHSKICCQRFWTLIYLS